MEAPVRSTKGVLDPVSRVSEILFGLIMVLTFTCSISAAEAGREEIRTILVGAISCNIAWGLVDAVMYIMSNLTERARTIQVYKALRKTADQQEARQLIADALPPVLASVLRQDGLELVHQRLMELPEPPPSVKLQRSDWVGAIGVFLLVFLSTFPVVIPFIFMHDATQALRISNLIAIFLLFFTGYSIGKYAGQKPWHAGFGMVVTGIVLVAITMALGG